MKNYQEQLELYLKNPNYCLVCRTVIMPNKCQTFNTTNFRNRQYCSRECRSFGVCQNRYPSDSLLLGGSCTHCSKPCKRTNRYCSGRCRMAAYRKKLRDAGIKEPVTNRAYRLFNWRKNVKQKALELLGGKCILCGYNRCTRALHFHHLNPAEKSFEISRCRFGWKKIEEELKKCVLLCSNCHAEVETGLIFIPQQFN